MKRSIFILAIIFGLFSMISAQSGRKIETVPTPETETVKDDKEFSESAPRRLPQIYVSPKTRAELEKRKKTSNKTKREENPKSTAEVVTDNEDVVYVETNLVTIPVSVFDRNGVYIPNLQKEDFKIYENGAEQEVAYFGTSDKPFTVVLLLDTSPSTAYKIEEIQEAAIAFTNQLKPQDKVAVIEFDGNVHVLTGITNDRQKIHKAIREADFGYNTSLYDAVDYTFEKTLSRIEGRKAIVLFTDGVDTTSRKSSYDRTLYIAQEFDALIFPVYYDTFFDQPRYSGIVILRPASAEEYALGRKYLDDLAASTGGRVFRPEAIPGGLTKAFEGIAEELRRQYNIGYYPPESGKAGEVKQIRVRVNRPNLVVRARDSYITGGNMQNSN